MTTSEASLMEAVERPNSLSSACTTCNGFLPDASKGFECDSCHEWECLACAKIPADIYSSMKSLDVNSYNLNCTNCKANPISLRDTLRSIDRKLATVTGLDEKMNTLVSNNLETAQKIETLEEKMTSIEDRMDDRIDLRIENRLKEIRETANESKDREFRSRNVMMFKCQESTKDSASDRQEEDRQLVRDIITQLGVEEVEIISTIRMGPRVRNPANEGTDNQYQNVTNRTATRPLKVTFGNAKQQRLIITNNKKIAGSDFKHISIAPDYTPKQREDRAKLVRELVHRRENGESLMIKKGRIVPKPTANNTAVTAPLETATAQTDGETTQQAEGAGGILPAFQAPP